jgi:hypothetical protein
VDTHRAGEIGSFEERLEGARVQVLDAHGRAPLRGEH